MSEHTKEPWKYIEVIGGCSVYAGQIQILSYMYSPDAENRANARRIVACVNACAGITIEALEGDKIIWVSESDHSHLERQRDELLAAAKEYASHYLMDEKDDPSLCFDDQQHKLIVALFDAIAKAEATK